uniref:Uncharacterized protein n=1 Tax=Kwoniella dejecticola CBS 10117 TaxID=1296121 RepID=A0A1A5ZVK3_9TREE|nr:uncharacterized protein I303_07742 [Kwoniella dejecticola CBS 10117]OBR81832.1 hypothetical protein I303_07742 [Kwoniella dejecticola CBS 10117]
MSQIVVGNQTLISDTYDRFTFSILDADTALWPDPFDPGNTALTPNNSESHNGSTPLAFDTYELSASPGSSVSLYYDTISRGRDQQLEQPIYDHIETFSTEPTRDTDVSRDVQEVPGWDFLSYDEQDEYDRLLDLAPRERGVEGQATLDRLRSPYYLRKKEERKRNSSRQNTKKPSSGNSLARTKRRILELERSFPQADSF